MFITLLVATTTLDGLPPYRMVLNCFHLFWTIVLIYFKLFWYILLGWFYRLIIVLTFKSFTLKLFTFKFFTLFPFTLFPFTLLLCFRLLLFICASPSPFMVSEPLPPLWYQSHSFLAGCKCGCVLCFLSVSTQTLDIPLLCSLLTVVGATLVVKWIPRT